MSSLSLNAFCSEYPSSLPWASWIWNFAPKIVRTFRRIVYWMSGISLSTSTEARCECRGETTINERPAATDSPHYGAAGPANQARGHEYALTHRDRRDLSTQIT